jgi:hypothetical protein
MPRRRQIAGKAVLRKLTTRHERAAVYRTAAASSEVL